MDKPRIFLADDHEMIRDGLRMLLNRNNEFDFVGEAGSGKEVLSRFESAGADLLILDISMPDMNGLEVAKKLLSENPGYKIIVLSMYNDDDYISKCIETGVMGYVVKNEASSELRQAVDSVLSGQLYFSQQAQKTIFRKYSSGVLRKKKEMDFNLTEREIEIIKLIAEGLTSNQIAEKLFISPRTVDTHRANIMKKAEVKNSIELVKKMQKLEII